MEAEKYSKVLVAGDVKDRLTVPEKWMEILEQLFVNGNTQASLRVIDWLGNGHDLRLAIRKTGPYRKPVVQSHEWKTFVAYAGLRAGNKIIIYRLDEAHFRGATHRVVVQRPSSDGLWAYVPTPQRVAGEPIPFF